MERVNVAESCCCEVDGIVLRLGGLFTNETVNKGDGLRVWAQ